MDVVGTLDGRTNEFERLVCRPFEAMGFGAWSTEASQDDGVGAVARNKT